MKERIIGIDVARALAIFGMILVNFKVVLGANGSRWVKSFTSFFDGKAAATFVVLAGVGIALMTKTALRNNDLEKLNFARRKIAKRALFLFVIGLSYIVIWPADILHFYGVYMLLTLLLLKSSEKVVLLSTVGLIFLYPILIGSWNYETGWDFKTLEYEDFWTFNGFVRNLFFNGFHPVIPWASFMLFGFWLGKQDLYSNQFIKKAFWVSSIVFIAIQLLSPLTISILSAGSQQTANELNEIIGTSPMPPLPVYMINGIAIATSIISGCILLGNRFSTSKFLIVLNQTGQLALTFYVAHVIIGMGIIEVINPQNIGDYPIEFSVSYALGFSILCIVFAKYWLKWQTVGPLEWVMKKILD